MNHHGNKHGCTRRAAPNSAFMTLKQVMEVVPLGRTSIYSMMEDGSFPKSKKIGARAIVWSKKEIDSWIAAKLEQP